MMISTAKKAGTMIGGTNHDPEVPELSSFLLASADVEPPPSSCQRSMAAAYWSRSILASLDWVILFKWGAWPPTTRADHEHVRLKTGNRSLSRV